MIEEWRSIRGFAMYEVSSLGSVRSLFKDRCHILKKKLHKERNYVSLRKDNLTHTRLVSRLVADAFILNPENKPQVNHENLIKSDDRAENLVWITQRENMEHARKHHAWKNRKGWINQSGSGNNNAKLTWDIVHKIRELAKTMPIKDLAQLFEISYSNARYIVLNITWKR